MEKKLALISTVVIMLVLSTACDSAESQTPTSPALNVGSLSDEQIITLGDISDDPASSIEDYQPMAQYLASQLSDWDIQHGDVRVAPDLGTIKEYLKSGEVDIFFESGYGALTVYEETGAFPLARRWKKGVDQYHSLIIVRSDSGIVDLEGLLGNVIAFEDIGSTSGYLLPKAHLVNMGFDMSEVVSAEDNIPDETIGYIFAGGEENVIAWLLDGKTTAAGIPVGGYEDLSDEEKDEITILGQTAALPRHIVMVSATMDASLRSELFDILVNMEKTSDGQDVLFLFEKTTCFDALPLGSEGTMQALEALFENVR